MLNVQHPRENVKAQRGELAAQPFPGISVKNHRRVSAGAPYHIGVMIP